MIQREELDEDPPEGVADAPLGAIREGDGIGTAGCDLDLCVLAEQQAALRRVATLVARGVPRDELFAAVTEEVVRVLPVDSAQMGRYDSDGTITFVGAFGTAGEVFPPGTRVTLGGRNVSTRVALTGRATRIDNYADASGSIGLAVRASRFTSAAGTPITVEGRLWGVMIVGSRLGRPLPADTEDRLGLFTELLAVAIANAESRAALAASSARVRAAADETRRRIKRDLHDGAQQRLVHAVVLLKLALRAQENGDANAGALVAEALSQAEHANGELRELAHGVLPAALTHGGLRAGVDALVSRVLLPVSVEISVGRLPPCVEATAYFAVSEALTNVVKHAHASRVTVTVQAENGALLVEIRDDGIGGAKPVQGSGLIGLRGRADALGGTLALTSPPGIGTTLRMAIPLEGRRNVLTEAAVAGSGQATQLDLH